MDKLDLFLMKMQHSFCQKRSYASISLVYIRLNLCSSVTEDPPCWKSEQMCKVYVEIGAFLSDRSAVIPQAQIRPQEGHFSCYKVWRWVNIFTIKVRLGQKKKWIKGKSWHVSRKLCFPFHLNCLEFLQLKIASFHLWSICFLEKMHKAKIWKTFEINK